MRRMRKLVSFVLAMVMVMAMAMNVSAADTYTITINNSATGHVYEAYQIFAGDLSADKTILSNVVWGNGVNGDELLTALQAKTEFAGVTSAADVAAKLDGAGFDSELARTFAAIAGDHLATAAGDSEGTENPYVISDLDAGYYLVKDQKVEGHDSYTRYILKVVESVEVTHKGTVPTVDKEIVEGETTSETGDYNIGDDVTFRLTGTLPENYADYDSYKYVFHDTLSSGLAFNEGSVKVTADGKDITANFTVRYDNGTLTIACADLKAVEGLTATSEIVVEYTAKLDKDAVIGGEGNPNTVYLEFSNDPNFDGEGEEPTGETPEDTVVVFTFELDVTKVDGEDATKKLEGAEFKLRNEAGKWLVVDAEGKVTSWVDSEADGSTLTSDANGFFNIIGLEDGTYYLKETKAPDGYNLLADEITIVITSTYDETGVKTLTIKVDNGNATDGNTTTGVVETTVVNNAGATLPETGGMGTTMFYIIGAALVIFAGVTLVTRKRMNA